MYTQMFWSCQKIVSIILLPDLTLPVILHHLDIKFTLLHPLNTDSLPPFESPKRKANNVSSMAYLPVLLLPGFCCFFPPFIPCLTQSCEKGWKTPLCLREKGDFARQKYHNSLEPWMEMYICS